MIIVKLKHLTIFAGFFLCLMIAGASSAAPSTGNITIAFIMVEFEDQEFQEQHDQDYFEDLAFESTNSMWHYYDEVSKSKLDIGGDVYGPYTLDGNAADYSSGTTFVRDSVEISDEDIDFRDYDAVMAIHSGPGGESTGDDDDIWSAHWSGITIDTDDGDYQIKKITQVPEYENSISGDEKKPLGVWCHEFGHELGLPDLYDTDESSEGIGRWGLMAAGSWTDDGETPAYFSAWSRYWLDWIDPLVITDDINNLELEPIENEGNVYLLPIPGNWSNSNEYYLIENRQQLKYDSYLPGEGLLIWHIDENVMEETGTWGTCSGTRWKCNTVNRNEDHKGIDLEEADGEDDLDNNENRGDPGDPYNSGSFTKDTYPNSLAYNGTESGWKIENIETNGDNIIVDISFLSKPHAVADADEAVIAEGIELQFYGHESWDEDGNIVNYTWDFGDGFFNYTENPTHIFSENGEYNVTLTVRDNNDLEDTYILNIFVNKLPIANVIISNTTIMLGESITFDASNSYDLDGEIDFYYWNFDDGQTSNEIVKEHTYSDSGIFNVSLKLIDNLNDINTTYYIVEVINALPNANFTFSPDGGNTQELYQFTDASTDSDGTVDEWSWNFGDGNESDNANPTHSFSFPGEYTISLTVIDDQGGENTYTKLLYVENSAPNPNIGIDEGLWIENNIWEVPTNRNIRIDAGKSTDHDNRILTFSWSYDSITLSGQYFDFTFDEETYIIELAVTDARGATTIENFTIIGTNVPILSLNYDSLDLVVNEEVDIISSVSWSVLDQYNWNLSGMNLNFEEINTNNSKRISFNEKGNYNLIVAGRDVQTELWTRNFELDITVYDRPTALFEFDNEMNEGTWIYFNGSKSTGLGLIYEWTLDEVQLESDESVISTYIDSGGYHLMNLTVHQTPVGIAYYEYEIYLNSKPTGVLKTSPALPRVGEDFELYLNAFDVETDANIDYLKIKIIDNKGNERGNLEYSNEGANFNLIFEVEYAGQIILEYSLTDLSGNKNESTDTVSVIGWADIYVDELKVTGSKEKGKMHKIETILKNYNETYNTTNYNGYTAKGYGELFIDSELVHTFQFSIDPETSASFIFEWQATGNYHEFEVKTYVDEGEVITNNNNYFKSEIFKSERKSGLLTSLPLNISIILICLIASLKRSKPN